MTSVLCDSVSPTLITLACSPHPGPSAAPPFSQVLLKMQKEEENDTSYWHLNKINFIEVLDFILAHNSSEKHLCVHVII